MLRVYAFAILLALSSGYAIWKGGAPERFAGGSLSIAYVATILSWSPLPMRFYNIELNVFAVDLLLLIVLLGVALRADRAWPLLITALQFDAVAVHFVKLIAPETIRAAYALLMAIWSWPTQIILMIATWRHVRRVRLEGYDRSWSISKKGR